MEFEAQLLSQHKKKPFKSFTEKRNIEMTTGQTPSAEGGHVIRMKASKNLLNRSRLVSYCFYVIKKKLSLILKSGWLGHTKI